MKVRLKQILARNPYAVFLVDKDGTVLYSNETGEPLLQELGTKIGEKLPPYIVDTVQWVISQNRAKRTEVKVRKKSYVFVFQPLKGENSVNIYGFDVTD
jgi:transcriptional regulator of aromatic amino acid metabolism